MQTTKVEKLIYQNLKAITGVKGIYHNQAEAQVKLPYVVYSVPVCKPDFFADDNILYYSASVRFHIVTKDGNFFPIEKQIEAFMLQLDAVRYSSFDFRDHKELTKIIDFRLRFVADDEDEETADTISADSCTCKHDLVTKSDVDKFFNNWRF